MEVIKIRLWLGRSRVVGRQWSGKFWRTTFIILYMVADIPTRVVNRLFPVIFGEIVIVFFLGTLSGQFIQHLIFSFVIFFNAL